MLEKNPEKRKNHFSEKPLLEHPFFQKKLDENFSIFGALDLKNFFKGDDLQFVDEEFENIDPYYDYFKFPKFL